MGSDVVVIEGMVDDLVRFRPSDWAERIAGNMAVYGRDRRLVFSPALMPLMYNGVKSLQVSKQLAETHTALYDEIMAFAYHNHLTVIGGDEPYYEELLLAS